MNRQLFAGYLMLVQVALPAAAGAETPCDSLRSELRALAAQHPEATEDAGDGHFLGAVIGPKSDDAAMPGDYDCKSFGVWLQKEGFDASLASDLGQQDDMLCWSALRLYDHRLDGDFIALAGTQGSAHCPVVQVFGLDKNGLRLGWNWDSDCYPASFGVVRIDGRAYPAKYTPKFYNTDLSYRLDLISVDPNIDDPMCGLSITYQPEFVGHWFGPTGENDVDPELRRVVEPIISALGAGRDVQELVKPWLDRPQSEGPYDLAISGYPERAIEGMRYPNTGDHVYGLPWSVPYLGGKYDEPWYSGYGGITEDAAIPLVINGRRLLLIFGYAWTPGTPPPDAGFGLYEYNDRKRDFDGVAGGVVERRGKNPKID